MIKGRLIFVTKYIRTSQKANTRFSSPHAIRRRTPQTQRWRRRCAKWLGGNHCPPTKRQLTCTPKSDSGEWQHAHAASSSAPFRTRRCSQRTHPSSRVGATNERTIGSRVSCGGGSDSRPRAPRVGLGAGKPRGSLTPRPIPDAQVTLRSTTKILSRCEPITSREASQVTRASIPCCCMVQQAECIVHDATGTLTPFHAESSPIRGSSSFRPTPLETPLHRRAKRLPRGEVHRVQLSLRSSAAGNDRRPQARPRGSE